VEYLKQKEEGNRLNTCRKAAKYSRGRIKIGKPKARFKTRDAKSNVGAIENAAAISSVNA
jgi:hypothetical protein